MLKPTSFIGAILSLFALLPATTARAQKKPVKDIVLVHGAWVDGSGWKPVYEILVKDGYHVSIVQEPLISFDGDVVAARRIIDLQPGPVVLVGHSYGGSVISQAGADSKVVSLVYVAAHMPDAGESEAADGKKFPSDLARSDYIQSTPDKFNFLDPSAFPSYFAADLPKAQADFEAHSQILTAIANFGGIVTIPAWRSKPSWMIVAGSDRVINPDLERWYAKRANSHTTEVAGASHSVYESRPKEVAAVIEKAAEAASK
jgi:pimeloyl-ACP methyl ester carboxylesterase